jgi:hypothetical protein
MRFTHLLSVTLLILCLLGATACTPRTPHSDPMASWKALGTFSNMGVPETIKQDANAYFQTLPAIESNESQHGDAITYWEDGTGQHAVVLATPHNGEHWHHAIIYNRDNKRLKVIKYSTGSYMS